MWELFEVLVNIFQSVLMLQFLKSRLHVKHGSIGWDSFCIGLTATLMTINSFPLWGLNMVIPEVVIFAIPIAYMLRVSDDRWYITLFWGLVLVLLFDLAVSLVLHLMTSILNMTFEEMMQQTFERFSFVFVSNAFVVILLNSVAHYRKDYDAPNLPVLLLFAGTIIAFFVTEEYVYSFQLSMMIEQRDAPFSLTAVYTGLTISLYLIILLYNLMSQNLERISHYRSEEEAIAKARQYHDELSRLYTDLCHARHDMKQHYQVLEELVASGGNERATVYLKDCKASLEHEDFYLTGSTAVDALVHTKSLFMKKHAIQFLYSSYPLEKTPIPEADFCTILGNLLDNAIEGVQRLPSAELPRTIQLTMSQSWDMFYIYCSNPCNVATIKSENGRWHSSKDNEGSSDLHAIGIRSIERLVYAAEGRCSFLVSDGKFTAKIVLPCDNNNQNYI